MFVVKFSRPIITSFGARDHVQTIVILSDTPFSPKVLIVTGSEESGRVFGKNIRDD
jgi:hypothetical protein